ncbi:hypothetical protein EFK50_16555 [Nocardioides marmoriginsengisoli]|uniref:Uncharacterized protein n=1 Tax=Nocardioides marmoriginsengisoli TaxID=661483 RepID=A0A3N0CC29_9ACTN|nr:hypothetical protein [Nocardioides marmoriginsengisoli]RNL60998.1 hypothetical protein EFK50_16555 [Nocardioides marmoriginsengisoli]
MIPLHVTANLDIDPWRDLEDIGLPLNIDGQTAKIERIGVLPNATHNGRACVELLLRLPDGRLLIAETTMRLFNAAAAAIAATPVAQLEEL